MTQKSSLATRVALLVDPDSDTRELYKDFLGLLGWSVLEAESGPGGLATAISGHADVIVSETRLPGFDGITLYELIRRDVTTQRIPFVFVTADSQPKNLATATGVGADVVLTKPCLPDQLFHGIRAAMELSKRIQAEPVLLGRQDPAQASIAEAKIERLPKGTTLKRAHVRGDTLNPPHLPPPLHCPVCDDMLQYVRSHIGGVSSKHSEQWDYFECRQCGAFEYRVRTRRLRRIEAIV